MCIRKENSILENIIIIVIFFIKKNLIIKGEKGRSCWKIDSAHGGKWAEKNCELGESEQFFIFLKKKSLFYGRFQL